MVLSWLEVLGEQLKNYLNTVKESINTVKLSIINIVLLGGFVSKVFEGVEGSSFGYKKSMYVLGFFSMAESTIRWSKEVLVESRSLGKYTKKVATGLVYSTVLFVGSEMFLFMSLIGTSVDGHTNQSQFVCPSISELSSPLFSYGEGVAATLILLMSSCLFNTYKGLYDSSDLSDYSTVNSLSTEYLGIAFMLFQLEEYTRSSASLYSALSTAGFFMVTGFHGLHVALGWAVFSNQMELVMGELKSTNNVGLFYSLFYWHFVDAVWFIVIIIIYHHQAIPFAVGEEQKKIFAAFIRPIDPEYYEDYRSSDFLVVHGEPPQEGDLVPYPITPELEAYLKNKPKSQESEETLRFCRDRTTGKIYEIYNDPTISTTRRVINATVEITLLLALVSVACICNASRFWKR
mmetsp:Transcript_2534/g.9542  ORF Transcript_2534/g.9542 Transcript_2534/m.9542 type:complete len:404 (-) Transcript_2534:3472-4683(-)